MPAANLFKKLVLSFLLILLFLVLFPSSTFASYYSSFTLNTDVGHPTNNNPPPNTNTCGGVYPLPNPWHNSSQDLKNIPLAADNFGDPNCEIAIQPRNPNNLYNHTPIDTLINQLDPKYASIWLNFIIPNESNWDPNAIEHTCAIQSTCAWGLVQMDYINVSSNKYNDGAVYWKQQLSNAINYNQGLNQTYGGYCGALGSSCPSGKPQTWCYWATAPKNMLCQPL